jgi:hypothetical protein
MDTNFQDWIGQLSDRSLLQLWVKYCGATENETPTPRDTMRAYIVSEEVLNRRIHPHGEN